MSLDLAALLGFTTGYTEKDAEIHEQRRKAKKQSLLDRATAKGKEQQTLDSEDIAFALPLDMQVQMGLSPAGPAPLEAYGKTYAQNQYRVGDAFVLPNAVPRGKTATETISNVFSKTTNVMGQNMSLLAYSKIKQNDPRFEGSGLSERVQKSEGILRSAVAEVYRDYREKGEYGSDKDFKPVYDALGYWDLSTPDRAIMRGLLTAAINTKENAAEILGFLPEDPAVDNFMSARWVIDEEERTVNLESTSSVYEKPDGSLVLPTDIPAESQKVMYDISLDWSPKNEEQQQKRFADIFRLGNEIDETNSSVTISDYTETISKVSRLRRNGSIKSNVDGILSGPSQLIRDTMGDFFYDVSFQEAAKTYAMGALTEKQVYIDKAGLKTGVHALELTAKASAPSFYKSLGIDTTALARSQKDSADFAANTIELLELIDPENPEETVETGALASLDQALSAFGSLASRTKRIINRSGLFTSALDDANRNPEHYLYKWEEQLAAAQNTLATNSTDPAARQAIATLLKRKLAYTFARSLESSTGNARLSDTDVRLAAIATGLEGLLSQPKTARAVLRVLHRRAQREADYKDLMLNGSMSEKQAAEHLKRVYGQESMLRLSDTLMESGSAEEIKAAIEDSINQEIQRDPTLSEQYTTPVGSVDPTNPGNVMEDDFGYGVTAEEIVPNPAANPAQ